MLQHQPPFAAIHLSTVENFAPATGLSNTSLSFTGCQTIRSSILQSTSRVTTAKAAVVPTTINYSTLEATKFANSTRLCFQFDLYA